MTLRFHHVVFALTALIPLPVLAQTGTPPAQSGEVMPDPERLALARQVVAIVLPPDQAEAMTSRILDAIVTPMFANIGDKFDGDPGLKKIWTDFRSDLTASTRDTMRSMIPDMRNAYAMAYARHFTQYELSQILAFGQTPTGGKYMSRSSELMQDGSIKAMMVKSMTETSARLQPLVASFKVKIKDYLAAHPDVAKKLAQ